MASSALERHYFGIIVHCTYGNCYVCTYVPGIVVRPQPHSSHPALVVQLQGLCVSGSGELNTALPCHLCCIVPTLPINAISRRARERVAVRTPSVVAVHIMICRMQCTIFHVGCLRYPAAHAVCCFLRLH